VWKVTFLTGTVALVGTVVDGLPLSAVFVLALAALTFGLIFILVVESGLERATSEERRREHLLAKLADFVDRAETLERACKADNGSIYIKRQSNRLHNDLYRFLRKEMDDSVRAQMKSANRLPAVVPPGFPAERLELLAQIHGRKEFLRELISKVRNE
jgi:hypothetical protein